MYIEETKTLQLLTPRAFLPLIPPRRYKDANGGRGSGKSHFFADTAIDRCMAAPTRIVCVREVQKSLEQSVFQLLKQKIDANGLNSEFKILKTHIEAPNGGLIIFQGMQNHTSDSIKSLEGFDIAWVEEAQRLSQHSLDMLYPTIRKDGSEIWFSRNRISPKDPVDVFFRENADDPDFISITANYWDNPFFPEVQLRDMQRDRRRDPDKYQHIWCGAYQAHSEARVFRNFTVEEFETPPNARFYHGADWGYSIDPTVLVRGFIDGRTLYIDQEAYVIGCETDHVPFLFAGFKDQNINHLNRQAMRDALRQPWANDGQWPGIPNCMHWPIIGDSARPETISYLQKHGFPNIKASRKGKNSVQEGIEFIRSYDVVIHPRCVHTADEFTNYSYKVDKLTEEVLPVLSDKKNHVIDSVRYMLERLRVAVRPAPLATVYQQVG